MQGRFAIDATCLRNATAAERPFVQVTTAKDFQHVSSATKRNVIHATTLSVARAVPKSSVVTARPRQHVPAVATPPSFVTAAGLVNDVLYVMASSVVVALRLDAVNAQRTTATRLSAVKTSRFAG